MMKRIRFLLTGLLLAMGSSLMMAQDDWNPNNPPEPAVKYKVTTSASPSSCYTSGGGSYSPGQQIWINSSSYSSGYRFLYWTKNGERYSEQQSFNYTVEEQDVAFVAYYEYNPESPAEPDGVLSYRLYLLTNLPGCCSFNRGSGDKVKVGETVGLNAYLNQGYKFLGWYMGDELLSNSIGYNYQMPANDVTLTAMVEYSPDNPDDPPSNRPLTPIITVKNCERVYGDANPVFEYVKNKEIAGEPVITCEADATSPVGTYTIKIERGTIEDESVVLIGGTLTITKSPLTISAGYYTRNLGEDNPAFVPTYSGFKNDETNEVLTTQPTVSCEATKESPVGEYEVTVSGAEATNYNISYVNGKLTVVEPYLTVTANSYSRVYGDANPDFGYTVAGGVLYGTPTITCDATETSPVGTYTITIAQGDVTSSQVTYVNGILTITKAPLTIKAGDYTKTRGEDNPTFTLTYEGFKNNETNEVLTTKPTVSCEATKDSPKGEYEVIVSGAEATNYNISYVNGKLTVVEPYLTVTANSYSRVYGDANPDFGYTVTGGVLYGTPIITCDATETSPVGTYTITIAQGDVTSSQVTYVNGILTITKAPLTIKAGDYTKTRGEDNPTFTPTYEGFKNDETNEVLTTLPTVSCEATKDSPKGEYEVIVSGAEATNYNISYVNGKLTVVDPNLTVTANSYSRVYGDANPDFGYTVTGGELYGTPTITCDATATSPVGTYTITIAQGDVTSSQVTYVNGILTITKAPLTIKAGDYTKTRGEDNPTFTPTYEGFKNNETNEVLTTQPTVSCEATKDSPKGEYEVTVSGAEGTNYNISYVNGKLTVVEPYLTVTANSYSRVYGDANPDFGYTVTGGVLYGTPTITCDATATSPVGTYTITIAQGNVTSSQVTYVNGILTITKAPLTIKAGVYTRNQGEDNPTFTPTYEGFKNSENADVLDGKPTLTCVATKDSPVGEYDIIVSGAWDDNYEISYVNGKLTITPIVFESGTGEGSEKENTATYRVLTIDSTNPTVAITIGTDVEGSFTIPENVTYNGVTYKVTEIAPGAFENNVNISEITISGTISKIGANSFKGCSNLKTITVYATTPPVLSAAESRNMMTRIEDGSVFDGVDKENCILYVPEASINLYKSANVWKDFVNIRAIGETGIANIVINNNVPFDVYDINGRKIRNRVKTIEGLPKGLYIVNGKRILIH